MRFAFKLLRTVGRMSRNKTASSSRKATKTKSYGRIKIRSISAIVDVLNESKADLETVLNLAAVDTHVFSRRENTISFADLGRLIQQCVTATGYNDFGLRVGMRQSAGAIGLSGLAAIYAPTVKGALETIISSLRLSDTGGALKLEIVDGLALLSYSILAPGLEAEDQLYDGAIAMACNVMREFRGPAWNPMEALLPRRRPLDGDLFSRFFRAPIRFEADVAGLLFSVDDLNARPLRHDPDFFEVLTPMLANAITATESAFVDDVEKVLRMQILQGPITMGRLAAALRVSRQSLSRRLSEDGVTFSTVAQRIKCEVAQKLLLEQRSLAEIAALMGYADTTAFIRAFRNWTGVPPAQWLAGREAGLRSSPSKDHAPD